MSRLCLTLARLASAMWIGAALLFVLTSVAEQTRPSFDAVTKDTLALVRFPWYYGAGAGLLGLGVPTAAAAGRRLPAGLLLAAAVTMALDYGCVYRPLREALTPPGGGRSADFDSLHHWSEAVNAFGFLLTAAAAVSLCAGRDASERGASAP